MTNEEIDGMTEKQAKDRLKFVYGKKSLIINYLTIEEKMLNIANQFRDGYIDVLSEKDDPSFDRFIKFSKESRNIEDAQIIRLTMLDEDILAEEREKRLKARKGSIESFVSRPKRDN